MSSGKYLVVFKDSATQAQVNNYVASIGQNGGTVGRRLDGLLKGFSATIPDSFLQNLQSEADSVIDYIEPDSVVTTQ